MLVMDRRVPFVLTAAICFASGGAALGQEAASKSATNKAQTDEASAALTALEHAEKALAEWRKTIEAGAIVRDEDLAKLKERLRPIGGHAEWFLDRGRRDLAERKNAEPVYRGAREQAKAWTDAMRTLGPTGAEMRAQVVAKLRAALQGTDKDKQFAALQTLQQIGDVNYDKASFRPLILPLIEESTGAMLVSALYALFNTERRPEDLAIVQMAWKRRSPELDNSMSHLLFVFGGAKIEGPSEEIVLELLASPHASARREALRGLWGASISDRLAARIVELADDPESHGDAIYFGLSTLKPKNRAAVEKLIETLSDPDWNNWDRALWGLGYGIPKELQPRVAEALKEMYVARSDAKTRQKCLNLIRQYAGEEAANSLPK